MKNDFVVIFTTASSQDEAEKISTALLDARVASCVQMQPMKSMYHWKGTIEVADEIHLIIKSMSVHFAEIEKVIKENHSYETPQIVAIPIIDGSAEYLQWIKTSTE